MRKKLRSRPQLSNFSIAKKLPVANLLRFIIEIYACFELYPKNQIVAWDILFKVINDYLIEHPSERHHDAKILIRKSLWEAFRYNKN